VTTIEIFLCFQEEMMVQDDPIKLQRTKVWSRRSKSSRIRL